MIEVVKAGFNSLIQDDGRYGYQEFGMPISGVMDFDSYRLANWLVGNNINTEILEITLIGPELKFHVDTVIGITGADISPKIDGAAVLLHKTISIKKGSVLSFGKLKNGCRCYLAISGGLGITQIMGSKSTYSYANLGGLDGGKINIGDVFRIKTSQNETMLSVPDILLRNLHTTMPVRVLEGPEFDWFLEKDKECFFRNEFVVSSSSNRMGYRMEGVVLDVPEKELISSGVINGTVQVPNSGKPIVLLSDAQTTGGYPRIANVIKSDLSIFAQLKPGDRIRFRKVTLAEAQANYYNRETELQQLFEKVLK